MSEEDRLVEMLRASPRVMTVLETVRAWSFGKQLVQDAVAIAAPLL